LVQGGARQALPGEFSFRAVRNGKISISEAQATADLIAAKNSEAANLALEKLAGSQRRIIGDVEKTLKELAVLSELDVDFSDQDLEADKLAELKQKAFQSVAELQRLSASFERGSKVQEGVRVALVGLPNSGKSSFFNALLGEDRSIVSAIAGTTRDIVRESLTLRGVHSSVTLKLEDTAGLRASETVVEEMGIQRTLRSAREADLILLIYDGSSLPSQDEAVLHEWQKLKTQQESQSRTIGIITKCDLIDKEKQKQIQKKLEARAAIRWLVTSAKQGQGITESAETIAEVCEKFIHRSPGEVLLTHVEHKRAVDEAIEHLERAQKAEGSEFFSSDIRHAIIALAPLTGDSIQGISEELLQTIFSRFCIGK
ncbi:MAG: hypothetical protein A3K03_13195, partial [Bdellovibrionales bacterium RIFOXYD1_FULL_44_7]